MPSYAHRNGIIAGDRTVIKKIIAEFRPKFNSVLRKHGANSIECEEYFAIALKGVVENFILEPNKDVPDTHFFGYLLKIGLNRWRTDCKIKGKELLFENLPEPKLERTILEDIIKKEEHTAFMMTFQKLGKDCQELLWKKVVEGVRYQDLAQITGKSAGYLRVQLTRCKKYLIKLLNE